MIWVPCRIPITLPHNEAGDRFTEWVITPTEASLRVNFNCDPSVRAAGW
uniref:Lipoprotein n=1 Tax=Haemonchus contortus TaxID=6289 RepID=A0A7I4XXZ4_HAECO